MAGGVAGSLLTAQNIKANYKPELDFYQHRHNYRADDRPEERGEWEFTYYFDGYKGAFNRVATKQAEELMNREYKVSMKEIHEWLVDYRHAETHPANDFAIVHPLFFTAPASIKYLSKRHRYILAFEVADTTLISKNWARWANDPEIDGIFVPSKFAFETYTRSGVQNRVNVLPHGIGVEFKMPVDESPKNELIQKIRLDPRPKILYFCLHSGRERKGAQFVEKALSTLKERGRNFVLVVKTLPKGEIGWYDARAEFPDIPLIQVDRWLTDDELVALYDGSDLLIHPYRGGGFELNVFEALARGLPVIVTGWGCVLEYCDFHSAYLISPKEYVRVFTSPLSNHTGFGVNPDVDHFIQLIEFVLDNLEYCKKKAMRNRDRFIGQTWSAVIDQFLKDVEEIWLTH